MYFGDYLVRRTIINNDQLEEALRLQKETKKPLGETIVSMGIIDRTAMEEFLKLHLMGNVDNLLLDPEIVS